MAVDQCRVLHIFGPHGSPLRGQGGAVLADARAPDAHLRLSACDTKRRDAAPTSGRDVLCRRRHDHHGLANGKSLTRA